MEPQDVTEMKKNRENKEYVLDAVLKMGFIVATSKYIPLLLFSPISSEYAITLSPLSFAEVSLKCKYPLSSLVLIADSLKYSGTFG